MQDQRFDQDAWLARIGYRGERSPTLATLHALVAAQSSAIAYESIDVLLNRPPKLDLGTLQAKMIGRRRGGYCFEPAVARLHGHQPASSGRARPGDRRPRPMLHMVLLVELPEARFLADVGFGNLAPTAPLELTPMIEQETPHEVMRLVTMNGEFTLQSRLGDRWAHIYRVVLLPRFDAEYEMANWFTASHPQSPYLSDMIAARPGPGRTRLTLFNARFNVRHASGEVERRSLGSDADYREVLVERFGLHLSEEELQTALANMAQRAMPGPPHPFFA